MARARLPGSRTCEGPRRGPCLARRPRAMQRSTDSTIVAFAVKPPGVVRDVEDEAGVVADDGAGADAGASQTVTAEVDPEAQTRPGEGAAVAGPRVPRSPKLTGRSMELGPTLTADGALGERRRGGRRARAAAAEPAPRAAADPRSRALRRARRARAGRPRHRRARVRQGARPAGRDQGAVAARDRRGAVPARGADHRAARAPRHRADPRGRALAGRHAVLRDEARLGPLAEGADRGAADRGGADPAPAPRDRRGGRDGVRAQAQDHPTAT